MEEPELPQNLLIPLDVREPLPLVLWQLFRAPTPAFVIGVCHQSPLDVLQRHAGACAVSSLHVSLQLPFHLLV